MYCVCLDIQNNEMSIMTRIEREQMISVLQSLKQPIPTLVIAIKENHEDAKSYIDEIKKVNNLLENL